MKNGADAALGPAMTVKVMVMVGMTQVFHDAHVPSGSPFSAAGQGDVSSLPLHRCQTESQLSYISAGVKAQMGLMGQQSGQA